MHDHGPRPHHPLPSDPPAGHGMLVVGEQSVYLSHLPMFMSPHDYQVILEATFSSPGQQPQAAYVKDRQQTKVKVYTLDPEPFVLPELKESGADGRPVRSAFKGDLYRHHFERKVPPRVLLGEAANVDVKNVVYFQQFDVEAPQPADLTYLLFGKSSELFVAHAITSPPDFDHVLSVTVAGHQFADDDLRTAATIVIPGRANNSETRLKEGEHVSGTATLSGGGAPIAVQIAIGTEFYFEARELRSAS